MLKLPLFKGDLYERYMKKASTGYQGISFNDIDISDWIDFKIYLSFLSDNLIDKYKNINLFDFTKFVMGNPGLNNNSPIDLGNGTKSDYAVFLLATKKLIPTIWGSEYFLWQGGKSGHTGIDIMMPKGTPIPAFGSGQVVRAELANGYGNTVVIKSFFQGKAVYLGYQHLDSLKVAKGDNVDIGAIVGYAGTTGNSTQYHLHFQVDLDNAPFHPYYAGGSVENLKKFTMDPLVYLRNIYNIQNVSPNSAVTATQPPTTAPVNVIDKPPVKIDNKNEKDNEDVLLEKIMNSLEKSTKEEIFLDMPKEAIYSQAIKFLYEKGIIKGANSKILPNDSMLRYELALIIYRMRKFGYFDNKPILNNSKSNYIDLNFDDGEIFQALDFLYKYGIMQGKNNEFMPFNNIFGEEILAVLGRLIHNLKDNDSGNWYENYIKFFTDKGYIGNSREFIGSAVPRKEIFRLLYLVLK